MMSNVDNMEQVERQWPMMVNLVPIVKPLPSLTRVETTVSYDGNSMLKFKRDKALEVVRSGDHPLTKRMLELAQDYVEWSTTSGQYGRMDAASLCGRIQRELVDNLVTTLRHNGGRGKKNKELRIWVRQSSENDFGLLNDHLALLALYIKEKGPSKEVILNVTNLLILMKEKYNNLYYHPSGVR